MQISPGKMKVKTGTGEQKYKVHGKLCGIQNMGKILLSIYTHTRIHTHTDTHTLPHMHKHTHTHTHTHTRRQEDMS